MLYAAYRQYRIAWRELRGALAKVEPAQESSRARRLRLRKMHARLLHALSMLHALHAAAPAKVKRYWDHLARVGEKLPGLY